MRSKAGRRITISGIGVVLVGWAIWHIVQSQRQPPAPLTAAEMGPGEKEGRTAGLGCGPAALLAVGAAAPDTDVASRLRLVLADDELSTRPVSSFYELAAWARQAGLEMIGLHVPASQVDRLPLPLIAHLQPGHFVAVHHLGDAEAIVSDQIKTPRGIPRQDFDRLLSGNVLCMRTARAEPSQPL